MADGSTSARSEEEPASAGRLRVGLTTLGCRLNHAETDGMARMAREAGHEVVDFGDEADVYVVNTCTITQDADADSRQRIRQAARRSPGARVVVTGCYATRDPGALAALPQVAAVLGNRDKDRWLERLGAADPGRVDVCVSALVRHVPLASLPADDDPRRSRGHLKIQDGCDYRCSFCVVPAVRGRSASVEPTRVASQLAELVAAGLPEVVLTGVHLGTYGRDLSPRVDLRGLLVELLPRLGGARLRLGSLDPHEVDDALVELLAAERGRICRHLHLPVQSGDDAVLQRMRRAHRAGDLAALVPRLVQAVPGIAVGSDVIVGFPGEDEAAFGRTLELLEGLPVAYLHVFAYSRREGTAAASMPEQVAPEVRARRSQRLRALSTAKAAAFRAAQVGAEAAAVVQRRRDPASGRLVALTDNYVEVLVDGSDALLGHGVVVRIEDAGEAAAPHPRALGRVIDG